MCHILYLPIYGSNIRTVRNVRAAPTLGGKSFKGGNNDGNVYGHEYDDVHGTNDVWDEMHEYDDGTNGEHGELHNGHGHDDGQDARMRWNDGHHDENDGWNESKMLLIH